MGAKAGKERLDVWLAQNALAPSREAARRLIMSGAVYVDGQKRDKAGEQIRADAEVEVRGAREKFVSRGGYKLEKALELYPIDLRGAVCMDIGASTGGFTDCMLQNGAARVYAVDVGYGQLAWKLRGDPRVVNRERTNIRHLEGVSEPVDFISIDVSFISLALVIPAALRMLSPKGEIVALIKPQFEAGRENVGKKGVVRDRRVHEKAIRGVLERAHALGLKAAGLTHSPIKGPQGNIEYLVWLRGGPGAGAAPDWGIEAAVARSHEELDARREGKESGDENPDNAEPAQEQRR